MSSVFPVYFTEKIDSTYRKIHSAGTRVARKPRTESPHCFQMVEQFTIRAGSLSTKTLITTGFHVRVKQKA